MPDEAVAALCMLCYQDLNGKASSSSEHPEAAGGEGEAEASQLQALGAQKPTHHKAPTQVNRHAYAAYDMQGGLALDLQSVPSDKLLCHINTCGNMQ